MIAFLIDATMPVWLPALIVIPLALLGCIVSRFVYTRQHMPGGSHDHGPQCGEEGITCSLRTSGPVSE